MSYRSLWYDWNGLNGWLFALAQEARSAALEPALGLVAALGSFWAAPYYARVIGAAAARTVRRREHGMVVGMHLNAEWAGTLFGFLLATIVAAGLVSALKILSDLPRPWEVYGESFGQVALLIDRDGSFPSGHAAFAAVLIGSVWSHATSRMSRVLLLVYLASVGLARVLLGAHFPADVVGGYAVGLGSVWAARRLLRERSMGSSSGR